VRVAVVGAGAVGCLFGAYLARSGHSVELIGRPSLVAAVATSGLRVLGAADRTYRIPARTELRPESAPDCILLTVKTFDLGSAAMALARSHPSPLPILLPQNGLGVERTARNALVSGGWSHSEAWTVRAIHSVPATLVAPGIVREGGSGEVLLPEPESLGAAGPNAALFRDLLGAAGLSVRAVADLDREIWRKAVVNAAINPVTALHHVANGALAGGSARVEALTLLEEARRAADLAGFRFSEAEVISDFDRVVHATAANRSSMLQDLERGRPTEIESISGELLRVARAHGRNLPATERVVREIEQRAGSPSAGPQPS
jgi:2-dehydropantoate 2-reductase